jgi:hypothetical protein
MAIGYVGRGAIVGWCGASGRSFSSSNPAITPQQTWLRRHKRHVERQLASQESSPVLDDYKLSAEPAE